MNNKRLYQARTERSRISVLMVPLLPLFMVFIFDLFLNLHFIQLLHQYHIYQALRMRPLIQAESGRLGRASMVAGFTATSPIDAYHH